MADRISGFLEVGTDGKGNVVVNHPDLQRYAVVLHCWSFRRISLGSK